MALEPEKCYELLKEIPFGRVSTYKEVAQKLNTKAYRAVGSMIGRNPNSPKVPCHRVVKSDGDVGGYAFGVDKKIKLLRSENIEVENNKIKYFKKIIYKFNT
jgi:methylated-DNA-[protein]-cysteine S-methyltransferase